MIDDLERYGPETSRHTGGGPRFWVHCSARRGKEESDASDHLLVDRDNVDRSDEAFKAIDAEVKAEVQEAAAQPPCQPVQVPRLGW